MLSCSIHMTKYVDPHTTDCCKVPILLTTSSYSCVSLAWSIVACSIHNELILYILVHTSGTCQWRHVNREISSEIVEMTDSGVAGEGRYADIWEYYFWDKYTVALECIIMYSDCMDVQWFAWSIAGKSSHYVNRRDVVVAKVHVSNKQSQINSKSCLRFPASECLGLLYIVVSPCSYKPQNLTRAPLQNPTMTTEPTVVNIQSI